MKPPRYLLQTDDNSLHGYEREDLLRCDLAINKEKPPKRILRRSETVATTLESYRFINPCNGQLVQWVAAITGSTEEVIYEPALNFERMPRKSSFLDHVLGELLDHVSVGSLNLAYAQPA